MTEDEAKTKVCHKTLNPVSVTGVLGATSTSIRPAKCLGSECMAWRAHQRTRHETRTGTQAPGLDWHEEPTLGQGEPRRWTRVIIEANGYCGAAGAMDAL